jgi:hypothetical protein
LEEIAHFADFLKENIGIPIQPLCKQSFEKVWEIAGDWLVLRAWEMSFPTWNPWLKVQKSLTVQAGDSGFRKRKSLIYA